MKIDLSDYNTRILNLMYILTCMKCAKCTSSDLIIGYLYCFPYENEAMSVIQIEIPVNVIKVQGF